MTKLIILANSWKKGNRCIAGINPSNGRWVRPCFEDGEVGIPLSVRKVSGREPELLDVIEIPLADKGPHIDYQPENRFLKIGKWRLVGKATLPDIARYTEKREFLLHNQIDYVHHSRFIDISYETYIPMEKRKSLVLISTCARFYLKDTQYRHEQMRAVFKYGCWEYDLSVTDKKFVDETKRPNGKKMPYYLTISLGGPLNKLCYKLVAGIIPRR